MQPDAGMVAVLERIAVALERLAPDAGSLATDGADAFQWQAMPPALLPVARVSHVPLDTLHGIDRQKAVLLANTRAFAHGSRANNAMLWGARGTGKSSLVKAVHAACRPAGLVLIEIAREDIASLPSLLAVLRRQARRCVVFCDDLSFDTEDADYKALKSVLDGGIAGPPAHVLFYATSNRRHLMPRDMIDNERAGAIHGGEAVDEKVSLSDRFGLWLSFHACDQDSYLAMVEGHAALAGLGGTAEERRAQALAWAMERGGRSGRVAAQFVSDLAARAGLPGGE